VTRWRQMTAGGGTLSARCLLVATLLAANSCSFGDATANLGEVNHCVLDSECGSKHCRAGLCVEQVAATPLSVTLEVTPKRMPDGSQPFPIVAEPFALKSGAARFDLHRPVQVRVTVRDSSTQSDRVDAQVSFRPRLDSKFNAKPTQLSVVGSGSKTAATDVSVLLLTGVNYDVVVQPTDPTRAPYMDQFQVDDATPIEIDYGTIAWQDRSFFVKNVPSPMVLRAVAKATGVQLSNSAPVAMGEHTVNLRFQAGDTPYQLVLSPKDQAQKASVEMAHCRDTMEVNPTFTIDASSLPTDKQNPKAGLIDLPKLPSPIVYSGAVTPCPDQIRMGLAVPSTLPLDLKRTTLNYGIGNSISVSYETSTTAMWVSESMRFEFCTQVLPGDYVVIVTPPLNGACERFAERRTLSPAPDQEISDATLALQKSAALTGRVVTAEGNPIENASIDLVALGKPGVTLAESDPTVPLYNRSRQGVTAADGTFNIPADIGSYDVVVKPPSTSNFAWWVIYNVMVGSRMSFPNVITLGAPVAVTGTLLYEAGTMDEQKTLAAAEVHAYTVIDDDTSNPRSIEIGRGQADARGSVMLLLSPKLQQTW
jgi:hypothetical protein